MTLYKHFRSKEELILAVLRLRDERWRNNFMRSVEKQAKTPRERLLAMYDHMGQWFSEPAFYGCMFINAIGEYSDREDAISQACQAFKSQMTAFVEELANEVAVEDAHALAKTLSLLLEGAIVTAQVAGRPDSAQTAKGAAKVLVDNALKHRGQTVA